MIIKGIGTIGLAALLTTLGACSASSKYQSEPTPEYGQSSSGQQYQGQGTIQQSPQGTGAQGSGQVGLCPTQIPGTSVTPQDIDGGEALSFTTSGDVSAVRQSVHQLAQAIGSQSSQGSMGGQGGMQGGMGNQGSPLGSNLVAGSATAQDTQNGAVLILRPQDPAQLGQLREQVRMTAEQMSRGSCFGQGQLNQGSPQSPSESPNEGNVPEPSPTPSPEPSPTPTE